MARTRSHCCQINRARDRPIRPSPPTRLTSITLRSLQLPTTTTSPSPECACGVRRARRGRRTGARVLPSVRNSEQRHRLRPQRDLLFPGRRGCWSRPGTPLPGAGDTTIPFFATGNAGSETDYQAGGPNIHTLTIPNGQDSLWWYFGCFLNFYDPLNQIAGQQVQAYLPGTHHCLVAQIAYDSAPIPNGVSPMSWDQLAQRNLQFTAVDNPGPASTRRAPQTFDCRPSAQIGQPGGHGLHRRVDDRVGQCYQRERSPRSTGRRYLQPR